jgi:hypothetical protein
LERAQSVETFRGEALVRLLGRPGDESRPDLFAILGLGAGPIGAEQRDQNDAEHDESDGRSM